MLKSTSALGGFLLALNPLCMALLGWRGAGGLGAAETALYFFFGGVLMVVGGILVRRHRRKRIC